MSLKAVLNTSDGNDDKRLHDLFMEAWNLFEELEESKIESNSSEFQNKVKSSMENLEQATRFVSQLGLFSSNELIDEVSTESLQYLLLPFFLGKLTMKLNSVGRLNVLDVAEVYFKDYIQRCEDYEICSTAGNDGEAKSTSGNDSEMAQLMRAASSRNSKIAQFRLKKELTEKIQQMRDVVKNHTVDDEVKRDFFLTYAKKAAIEAKDELDSVNLEKKMVQMQKALKEREPSPIEPQHHQHSHYYHKQPHVGQSTPKPLQPFIITRNAAQKAVFGRGYPSLPVMTVGEFYEQRVQEGIFPDEEKVAEMNRAQAIARAQSPNHKEEEEKIAIEQQVESDDPEYLDRMRRVDEYKDVVRRGDGNRYNRS